MTEHLTGGLATPHGFFTRRGGVSGGAYASLNCGLTGADNPADVAENRARAARAIGSEPSYLVGVKQVHGTRVITAAAPWPANEGTEADALVTDRPHIALGIITADCVPVLFACSTGRIVGAAHAGWRGALAGVLEATVMEMRHLGADEISAIIGPCIHQPSYEVAADLRNAIVSRNGDDGMFLIAADASHWQFDLPGYVSRRLLSAGVEAEILPYDTYADPDRFFSHRRRTKQNEGPGGHQISIIMSTE